MTHTLLVSRHGASPARAGDFGQFPLLRGLVFSAAISPVPFAFQSPRSCRPSIRAMGEITRFMHGTERTSQRALTAQEIYTKWNTRNWPTEAGMNYRSDAPHPRPSRIRWTWRGRPVRRRSRTRLPRERQRLHDRSGRRWVARSKSDKLVCRYCGSDDLAPSFIKRRDRRCRKCFSKRYGSAARARKAKVKK